MSFAIVIDNWVVSPTTDIAGQREYVAAHLQNSRQEKVVKSVSVLEKLKEH